MNQIKNYHTDMNMDGFETEEERQKEWDRIFKKNTTATIDISEVDYEYILNQQGRCL